MERKHTFNLGYLIFGLAVIGLIQFWISYRDVAQLSYSEAIKLASGGQIQSVTLTETMIHGRFKAPQNGRAYFIANRVDQNVAAMFEKAGVEVYGGSDSNWLTTLASSILPALVLVGVWTFFFRGFAERQGLGGLVNIGKSKAKVYLERFTDVTFDDDERNAAHSYSAANMLKILLG
jgi:cell division protease FtsH